MTAVLLFLKAIRCDSTQEEMMTTDDEFTRRLKGFGLSEKEAQAYLHLLKYGPKTPKLLAKSLKTYHEDVRRTLNSLTEKGMARRSLDAPKVYAAIDLDIVLESALRKQESELREMEARKLELQELAKQQRFQPSDEVPMSEISKVSRKQSAQLYPSSSQRRD